MKIQLKKNILLAQKKKMWYVLECVCGSESKNEAGVEADAP